MGRVGVRRVGTAALARGARERKILDSLPAWLRPPALEGWAEGHALPEWRGGAFRRWLAERETNAATGRAPLEADAE